MARKGLFLTAVVALSLLYGGEVKLKEDPTPIPRTSPLVGGKFISFSSIVEKVVPSVVNISTTKVVKAQIPPQMRHFFEDPFFRRFFGAPPLLPQREQIRALGSGVIISSDGYIVTNNHVVAGATEIWVRLSDGRRLKGKLVGSDPETDLAVIKVEAKGLTPITFADSSQLKVGDLVLAVGNPFGLGESVTMGIVSGINRNSLGINEYENYIQTDAPINPGNSGGALVDLKGRLVGINTAILSRSGGNNGIGFAIPSNMVKYVVTSLIKTGKVVRGFLGVEITNIDPTKKALYGIDHGVLVSSVIKGSAAEKAGIKPGDIIVEVNGKPVKNGAQLRNLIAFTGKGKEVQLKVYRDGKFLTLTAKLGEYQPEVAQLKGIPTLRGVQLRQEGDRVLISKLAPNSYLAVMGAEEGDQIVRVKTIKSHGWVEIHSISQLEELLHGIKEGEALLELEKGGVIKIIQI
jgi:serine protease Do